MSSPSNHYYPFAPGEKGTKQASAIKGIVQFQLSGYHPLPVCVDALRQGDDLKQDM